MKRFILVLASLFCAASFFSCDKPEPVEEPAETAVPVVAVEEEKPEETGQVLDLLTETQPEEGRQIESKSWIGLVLIAGVLTFLLVGALIFRIMSRKGRY